MDDSYTTRDEAIEREIIAALGEDAASFNIDALANDVLTTTGEGSQYRYVMAVDADEFWEAVARHEN